MKKEHFISMAFYVIACLLSIFTDNTNNTDVIICSCTASILIMILHAGTRVKDR